MNQIQENELLGLLGYNDPPHSLQWYKNKFPDLPKIIIKFIIESLDIAGFFPKEINEIESRKRYHLYRLTIENENRKYVVRENNTDRGEVWNEKLFDNAYDAAKYLLIRSFTSGGSIKNYWDID